MNLSPTDAKLFVASAEHGSFTAAATAQGLTPSAVSKAVSRLEQRLGVRLFVRTTRSLHLTEEGAAFLERCAAAFALLDDAAEAAAARSTALRGSVRLGMPTIVGTFFAVPLLAGFLDPHPELSVEIVQMDRLGDFMRMQLDCAITIGELPDSGFRSRRLGCGTLVTVAAPAWLARHAAPVRPADLDGLRGLVWLRPDGRDQPWRYVRPDGSTEERAVRPIMRSDDVSHLVAGALAGLGPAHVPLSLVHEDIARGRLVRLLPEREGRGDPISLVWMGHRELPRRVRMLLDHISRVDRDMEVPGMHRHEPRECPVEA